MNVAHLKTRVKRAGIAAHLKLFGNLAGVKTNLLHYAYDGLVRAKFALSPARRKSFAPNRAAEEAAQSVRSRGYVPIPVPAEYQGAARALAAKVDGVFATPSKVVASLSDSGLVRVRNCMVELPELEQVLLRPDVYGAITAYFGAYFKVYSADVYRTFPAAPEKNEFYSLMWHMDNAPANMLKVMIYMSDVDMQRGPLSLVPKAVSAGLRDRGFWDRHKAARFEREIEAGKKEITGDTGTVILFTPQLCIHKATLPQVRHRDVAVFLLHPSLSPHRPLDEAGRLAVSRNFGHLTNPFLNTPLRTGDE